LSDRPKFTTRAVRAGLESDDTTGAVVPPLYLTSTFAFRGYGDKRKYDYSRSGNPTRDQLGEALADLEEGVGGVITASGMAAITLCGYLIPQGSRIVAPHDCYGGTYRLFDAWRKRGDFQSSSSAMRTPLRWRRRCPGSALVDETRATCCCDHRHCRSHTSRKGHRRAQCRQHVPVARLAEAADVGADRRIPRPSTSTVT
jgi:hypothetical protein